MYGYIQTRSRSLYIKCKTITNTSTLSTPIRLFTVNKYVSLVTLSFRFIITRDNCHYYKV